MHPTYMGMHFMELGSQVEACQDKVCPGMLALAAVVVILAEGER